MLDGLKDSFADEDLMNIVHDISNALSVVIASARAAEEQEEDLNFLSQKISKIVGAAEAQHQMVNNLRFLHSIKNSSLTIRIKPVKITDIITTSLLCVQRKISELGVDVILKVGPSDVICVDQRLFVNGVLNNLLFNILSTLEPGSQVIFSSTSFGDKTQFSIEFEKPLPDSDNILMSKKYYELSNFVNFERNYEVKIIESVLSIFSSKLSVEQVIEDVSGSKIRELKFKMTFSNLSEKKQ